MESRKDQIERLLEEGFDGDVMEALIVALKKTKVSSKGKGVIKEVSLKYGMADLKLKPLKFYESEIDISR